MNLEELHFIFSEIEIEHPDSIQLSGGINLELQNLKK